MNVLAKIRKEDLREFLNEAARYVDLDVQVAYDTTIAMLRSFRNQDYRKKDRKPYDNLLARWYRSVNYRIADFGIYDDPMYFCELWVCWVMYSRRYLVDIQKPTSLGDRSIIEDMGEVKSILDLGCGAGYTTAVLARIFPDASVIGTNLRDTAQYAFANKLVRQYGAIVVENPISLPMDLVFASEYFEHFPRPVYHLLDILANYRPKRFLIANAFNGTAIGHFNEYYHGQKVYSGRAIGREFNRTLRDCGYELVKTRLWNNRPAYWRKKGEV